MKTAMPTIAAKNATVSAIIEALDTRSGFLLIGHETPDEDCIASLVSFALLVTKFAKNAYICLSSEPHEHYDYLLQICKHNSIHITDCEDLPPAHVDTIVVCDTPKPEMMEYGASVRGLLDNPDVVKIEIDHHLEADSAYCGQKGYCLVDEASSSCELVGLIALKLSRREDLLEKYNITDLLSRNFVLAVLTGMIGDTKMGKYLRTNRERRFYRIFSSIFNEILAGRTTNSANYSSENEVFVAIGRLSSSEEHCYSTFMDHQDSAGPIGHVILDEKTSMEIHQQFTHDTVVAVSRSVADALAEKSKFVGLVVFYDHPDVSDFIQFRMRRSQSFVQYDLRHILEAFAISNGGGHEGAIGFRIPRKDIDDIATYTATLFDGVGHAIAPFTA
jgi:nanoRNase/pAp phosphatase (c-di-AMP/oligoRNAs hydrolase)